MNLMRFNLVNIPLSLARFRVSRDCPHKIAEDEMRAHQISQKFNN